MTGISPPQISWTMPSLMRTTTRWWLSRTSTCSRFASITWCPSLARYLTDRAIQIPLETHYSCDSHHSHRVFCSIVSGSHCIPSKQESGGFEQACEVSVNNSLTHTDTQNKAKKTKKTPFFFFFTVSTGLLRYSAGGFKVKYVWFQSFISLILPVFFPVL